MTPTEFTDAFRRVMGVERGSNRPALTDADTDVIVALLRAGEQPECRGPRLRSRPSRMPWGHPVNVLCFDGAVIAACRHGADAREVFIDARFVALPEREEVRAELAVRCGGEDSLSETIDVLRIFSRPLGLALYCDRTRP